VTVEKYGLSALVWKVQPEDMEAGVTQNVFNSATASFRSYLREQIRIWQSMSSWRTLCPLPKLGHRGQAINDYSFTSRLLRLRPKCRQYASVHASELSFGQPLHETHPHLLKAGERTVLTPPNEMILHHLYAL
jgi:hypothetical protein